MKAKVAIVRGAFLNRYEMQFYEPLVKSFDLTAFSSLHPFHDRVGFPVVKLPSPMDLPDFPYKMPLINRLFTDAHYLWGLEDHLRGFDIVHSAETYYRYTQQAINAKKRGYVKKVIATVLENIPFNNEGIGGRREYKARARRELDHIIALTQKTKAALVAEGADPAKITVINHYVDTNVFKPSESQQKMIATKNIREITILCCGRLEEYKGVMDILESARLLRSDPELKSISLKFRFVGDGSLRDRMDAVEVVSCGYDQMPEIYRQAQIYVAPSKPTPTWEEQYNTSLLEAQASGLPIVTTDSGGIPENVGDAAVLVKPGDIPALTGALKQYILNAGLRQKYAERARRRAIGHHDIKIGASKLTALYDELLQ